MTTPVTESTAFYEPSNKQGSESIPLDTVFTKRMDDLQIAARETGNLLELGGTSKWSELYSDKAESSNSDTDGKPGKVLNGFDHAEIAKAFKRDDLNKKYIDTIQPKGTSAPAYRDAQVYKTQIDLLAGMERELRMRYRSRVRMLAHGVARLESQGLDAGPIHKGIVNFVKLLTEKRT